MTNTNTLTVEFVAEKETKNTVKFEEVPEIGQPELMGTLYLKKFVSQRLGDPETITVTVSI